MAACRGSSSKWFFTREQLETTPSRRCGLEPDKELSYRQQAANLIQDMGQRLNVSQLTINTAIVYMHRFYMNHSFTKFHRNIISPTALFLAAKVEEQPRKLEHVIKVTHACLNPQETPLDTKSNAYLQQAQELVILETIVLQTLGFEITIEHPHTDVVKCSQLVRASKDLAQTSYFMATNSLHLTTFCLQYKPTVIACVCIHLACKWSNWEIPVSTDGKHWWEYVDGSVTLELLDELTNEFLQILEKTPSRLKRIRNWRATQAAKKPKADGSQSLDSSFPGSSMLDQSLEDSLPGVSSNPAFCKAASAFPVPLPAHAGSGPLSLDAIPGSYTFTAPSDWPQDQGRYEGGVYAPQNPQHQGAAPLSSAHASSSSSVQQHRTEKPVEFNPVKGGKLPPPPLQAGFPQLPPGAPAQKMSLDKYREKQHAAEMAGHKRHPVEGDPPYAPDHRKHSLSQHGPGGGSAASPLKTKTPSSSSSAHDRPHHHGDRRDKGPGSLKLRLPASGKEEPKTKTKGKVSSSERHSSSDEGGANRSKHSSPLVSREKASHRKHGHPLPHSHSGNGRGGPEGLGPGAGVGLLRSPLALVGPEGIQGFPSGPTSSTTAATSSSSSSSCSRKRGHPDASHNHHSSSSSSKGSKSSKGAAAPGGPRTSEPLPPGDSGHHLGREPRP
ncbi:LOW QUALITY PROTEIN: cyclin-T2a [Aplochiton taeniatus]